MSKQPTRQFVPPPDTPKLTLAEQKICALAREEYSSKQIGEMLGIKLPCVKAGLQRARDKYRDWVNLKLVNSEVRPAPGTRPSAFRAFVR